MILEAQSLGIDSCILTPESKILEILKLEKKDIVPVMIGLGYEKKNAYQKKRWRKKMNEIVYHECFKNKSG